MTALRVLNRGSTGWIPFIGVKISGHQPELWWSYSYSLFLFVAWGLSLNYYRVLNGAVLVLHNLNFYAHMFLDGVIKKQYILASVILWINLQYLTLNLYLDRTLCSKSYDCCFQDSCKHYEYNTFSTSSGIHFLL